MTKAILFAMIAVGFVFFIFGIMAFNSIGPEVSRVITGASPPKAIAMLAAGTVFAIVGLAGVFRGSKGNR